jgi:hypothetical protein
MNGGSNYVLWKHPIHGHHNYVLITILIEVYCDCANISYHYTPRSGKGGAAAGRDVEGLADLRKGRLARTRRSGRVAGCRQLDVELGLLFLFLTFITANYRSGMHIPLYQ